MRKKLAIVSIIAAALAGSLFVGTAGAAVCPPNVVCNPIESTSNDLGI